MKKVILLIITIMLFGCLLPMPYGYYQFARLVFVSGFAYLAYDEYNKKRNVLVVLYILLALLLQPFEKVHFTREVWNIIDVVIAAILLSLLVYDFVKNK